MNKRWQILCFIFTLSWCGAANAALIDRGGGMIYDSDLDVTWLQDANYAMTSGYDADGLMSWNNAMTWASALTVGGYEDWRLPTYDPSNPRPETPTSTNEIGSLWYELSGGDGWRSDDEVGPFINISVNIPGVSDFQWYWTGLEDINDPLRAWRIDLGCACWDSQLKSNEYYVWAVRDGDVAVPEPGSIMLLGMGLAVLGWYRRRYR